MRSGPEIQTVLTAFAKKRADYQGNERGEGHTFLNELFACYCVDRKDAGAVFEDSHAAPGSWIAASQASPNGPHG